jgi:MoaA/NifB/PqqE/SkfB family radical SAM enzyme
MFKFKDIKTVHLELTSNCQASCPMCARNIHGGKLNPNLTITEINLSNFKKIFTKSFLKQLEHIYMCGNFGDPILSNDLIKICSYIKKTNPVIILGIHTNGSARSTNWWKDLYHALPENHMVHFALDGLEDTHHLYRVGTNFKKILENAKAFIDEGGKAEWVFLSFKHNEHQIEEAKVMASNLGFLKFNHKATGRFVHEKQFRVENKNGEFLYNLEPPKENNITFISVDKIKKYREYIDSAQIFCKVKETKEIYIDARGHLYPCCFLGSAYYLHAFPTDITYDYHEDQRSSVLDFINYLGGWNSVDTKKRKIKDIINSQEWQNAWDIYWQEKKLVTCSRTCGKWDEKIITQYKDQFIKTDTLK